MFCKKCGAELSEGTAFCGQCGSAVEEPAAPAVEVSAVAPVTEEAPTAEPPVAAPTAPVPTAEPMPTEPVPTPTKKSRWKLIAGILAAVVVVAIVAVIAFTQLSPSEPEPIIGHWTSYAATDGDSVIPFAEATMDVNKDGTYSSYLFEKTYTGRWERHESEKTKDKDDRYYTLNGDLVFSVLNFDAEDDELNLLVGNSSDGVMVVFRR